MDELTAVLAIVASIIMLVLVLVLIFRVFKLVSDVEKIKNHLLEPSHLEKARLAYLYGNKEALSKEIKREFISNLKKQTAGDSEKWYLQKLTQLTKEYTNMCIYFGVDPIDFEKYKDRSVLL